MAIVEISQSRAERDLAHIKRPGKVAHPAAFDRVQRASDLLPLRGGPDWGPAGRWADMVFIAHQDCCIGDAVSRRLQHQRVPQSQSRRVKARPQRFVQIAGDDAAVVKGRPIGPSARSSAGIFPKGLRSTGIVPGSSGVPEAGTKVTRSEDPTSCRRTMTLRTKGEAGA